MKRSSDKIQKECERRGKSAGYAGNNQSSWISSAEANSRAVVRDDSPVQLSINRTDNFHVRDLIPEVIVVVRLYAQVITGQSRKLPTSLSEVGGALPENGQDLPDK